jgi:hypothetical protein
MCLRSASILSKCLENFYRCHHRTCKDKWSVFDRVA